LEERERKGGSPLLLSLSPPFLLLLLPRLHEFERLGPTRGKRWRTWSQSLSGWPSLTDSDVKRKVSRAAILAAALVCLFGSVGSGS
jgi:hypothetical protein